MQLNQFNGGLNTRAAPYLVQQTEGVVYENIDILSGALKPMLDDLDMVKLDGVIVVESLEEEVWPERIASFTKYKEKTYGITRISYYQKEENE